MPRLPKLIFVSLTLALLISPSTAGPSSKTTKATPREKELENTIVLANQVQERLITENRRLSNDVVAVRMEAASLKQQVGTLTNMNKALEAELATNQVIIKSLTNALHYHEWVLENRAEIIEVLQKEWEPKKEAFFTTAGGKGHLKGFEVEDAFFYKGHVIIPTLFLSVFEDGSGMLARAAVHMDPDKKFEVVRCAIESSKRYAKEELAGVEGASIEQRASEVPKSATSNWFNMSDDTKSKVTTTGITLLGAAAMKLFDKWLEGQ